MFQKLSMMTFHKNVNKAYSGYKINEINKKAKSCTYKLQNTFQNTGIEFYQITLDI